MQPNDNTELVYQAVKEIYSLEQPATRETVQARTELKMSVVDDRLSHLVNIERLYRVLKGHYAPRIQYPETRIYTITELPDGCTKLEIGDVLLTLTPRETRKIAMSLAGHASDAREIMIARPIQSQNAQLTKEVAQLRNQVKALAAG